MNRRSFLSLRDDIAACWRRFQITRLRGHLMVLGLTQAEHMTDEEIIEGAQRLHRVLHESGVTVVQAGRAFQRLNTR